MSFDPDTLHETQARINVTPLIDVLLVLLIVFLVGTPVLLQAIPSGLARTGDEAAVMTSPVYPVISLGDDGSVRFSDETIPWENLSLRLAEVAEEKGQDAVVLIRAGDAVRYGEVIQAMDLCRAVGIIHVSPVLESSR